MLQLVNNRWIHLVVVGAVTAIAGVILGMVLSGGQPEQVLGTVKLTTGGAVARTGDGWLGFSDNMRGDREVFEQELPLTGAQAVAAGWKDPFLCSQGRGKYFQKVDQDVPYFLMYDAQDELIGIYHISVAEMPPPWELTKEIYGGAGPVIEYEHWGLFFYFQDPTRACETQGSGVFMTSAG